jgi:uncharacterized membrane protein YeaQ/YmgE (transglycosylase-associated protein family)
MHWVGFLVFGILIGAVVRVLVAGKAGSFRGSILIGASGAIIGASLGRIGGFHDDSEPSAFVMSLLAAFALVAVYHGAAARRRYSALISERRPVT